MKTKKNTTIHHQFYDILKGSDLSERRIPLMIAESKNPGPVIWILGCEHGDEVGGIVVIQELFKIIKNQGLLKGKVYAIPILNPFGFESNSRQIPFSKEDLNRSYPGNPNGTLAERIAFKINESIKKSNPDLVLDLHNDWINSVPYILLDYEDKKTNKKVYKKMKTACDKSGLVTVKDNEEYPSCLSTTLFKSNIPALTLELGQSYVVDEKNVEIGVHAILNIMAHYEMILSDPYDLNYLPKKRISKNMLYYTEQPLSSKSGIIRFRINAGEYVKKNQIIAEIYDTFGNKVETLKTKDKGIILGHNDTSVSFPGTSIIAMASSIRLKERKSTKIK